MMAAAVVCLRPQADFTRVGVAPPASLSILYRDPTDPELAQLLRAARALVIPAVGPKLAPALFEGCRLELVQVTGAGVDRLDEATLRRLAIPVCNVAGGSNSAVAEYVVTAASLLLRRLAWSDAQIRAGRYRECRAAMVADNLAGLHGRAVGIVGLGTIGMAVASAFLAFGCKVYYHDPSPRDAVAAKALGLTALALDELLVHADVVTLHVPLTPGTRNLIDAEALGRMKPGAILVNASRGGVVDEFALADALRAGKLGGAALDVYATEPPDGDNPLFALQSDSMGRVLFTPHIAGVTLQSAQQLFEHAWANVVRVLVEGASARSRVY